MVPEARQTEQIIDIEIANLISFDDGRYTPEEHLALGKSILQDGQIYPLIAFPSPTYSGKFGLSGGNHRKIGMEMVGMKTAKCIISDRPESELMRLAVIDNIHRKNLSLWLKYKSCVELLEKNKGWQFKELGTYLHMSASAVTRIMCLSKCIPCVVQAVREGKCANESKIYVISQLPDSEQEAALALSAATPGRDKLKAATQRSAVDPNAPRSNRVKLPIRGVTAVLTGINLGMAEVVETLAELLKEARKAAETFDVTTFQKMMADRAKAAS